MILPINIREYTDKIARDYDNLPDGKEKEELWKEIERIAEKLYPTVKIEKLDDNEESQ